MTRGSGLGFLLAILAACSRAGTASDPVGSAAARGGHRGKVVISGSEPGTSVQLVSGGANLELVGTLEPELRPIQRLEVHDYEIIEIDGRIPIIGVAHSFDGQLWLTGADTLALFGMPDDFRAGIGAKVWVVGESSS